MRRSKAIQFFDFSGGLNTKSPVTSLAYNEALDLQNINLLPSGGFEKRQGNTEFNSSAMVSAATAVSGQGYFRLSNGTDFMVAVAGTQFFKSDNLDGTMDNVTGAVSITTGTNNIWTHSVMNDLSIWVGGAPDAPFKYSGSGNAAALGGSPPSGNFGIAANNRFFIGNTAANPSRIAWSILGNPEDWTGSGSGTQDVQTNDGDTLVGAAQLGVDHLLLFKQTSIHDLVIRTSPFPLFPLFRNVGAISKRGIVNVDGMVYFMTPQPRMKATDGTNIYDAANPGPTGISDHIDDILDGLSKSRLQYIHGIYYPKERQIMWQCSTSNSSTHDLSIIWDLDRKCWLRNTTGYKMNTSVIARDYLLYMGGYTGKIYLQDAASKYSDDSETAPGAISSFWRTGWLDLRSMIETKSFPYVDMNLTTQTTGTFDFGYGFDFSPDRSISSFSMVGSGVQWDAMIWDQDSWGAITDKSQLSFVKGQGKFVQFLFRNQNAGEAFSLNGFEIPVKINAPYALRS